MRPWAPSSRCSSGRCRARASGCRPRCCRRRSPCSISRPRAGAWRAQVPGQAGNDHPTSIPTGVFPTADGHINIAASGQHIFKRLCEALDAPRLLLAIRISPPATSAPRTACASTPRSASCTRRYTQRRAGREAQCGRRPVRADLHDRPDVRRSAGASMSAWPCRCRIPRASDAAVVNQAVVLSRTRFQHRPADAGARRAYGRGAGRSRLRRRRDRRSAPPQGDLSDPHRQQQDQGSGVGARPASSRVKGGLPYADELDGCRIVSKNLASCFGEGRFNRHSGPREHGPPVVQKCG